MKTLITRNEKLYGTSSTRRRMAMIITALLATTPLSAHAIGVGTHTGTTVGVGGTGATIGGNTGATVNLPHPNPGTVIDTRTNSGVRANNGAITSHTSSSLNSSSGNGNWMANPPSGGDIETNENTSIGASEDTLDISPGIQSDVSAGVSGSVK